MNKQRFLKVLKNPGNIRDELPNLQELQKTYPYAQAIHVLVAISHKQHNSSESGTSLNRAAMYVADRHNLKEIITSETASPKIAEQSTAENIDVKEANEAVKPKDNLEEKEVQRTTEPLKPQDNEPSKAKKLAVEIGSKFREGLLEKLEKLQQAKNKWAKENDVSEEKKQKKSLVEKIAGSSKSNKTKAKGKSKTKKSTSASAEANGGTRKAKPTKTKTKKSAKSATTEKATTATEEDKIKQQQELISKFIEKSPSIKAKASKPPIISAEQEDLSVPSTSFSDSLISENLAEIMISQGKDDKAIDIYKKLIWKFPQKKAYFATQIEELTKKKG